MSNVTEQPNKSAFRFIVLDSERTLPERIGFTRSVWVSQLGELSEALSASSKDTVWILNRGDWAGKLLEALSSHSIEHQGGQVVYGDLLMLSAPKSELLPSLHHCFRRVVGEVPFKMLEEEQLLEVLSSDDRRDLFIGGIVDEDSKTVTLARGDLDLIVVPLSLFKSDGSCQPDFSRFELDDYGYAIRFGDFEASAHSVLYKVDPEYRRKINAKRSIEDRGFGPSLRRLRLFRGLSQSDFGDVSSETIARIESGEVEKPQGKTLSSIAKRLGVPPEEIENY